MDKILNNDCTEGSLFSVEEAINMANQCLNCKNAQCVKACPASVSIPAFIGKIKTKQFEEAYNIIKEQSVMPEICSRVCPHESQCEGNCIRGIKGKAVKISKLESFVVDYAKHHQLRQINKTARTDKRVAVIGAGPAGLTVAKLLAESGHNITIYDKYSKAGGVLTYGIPYFRLDKHAIVDALIDDVKELGVKFNFNAELGKHFTIDSLLSNDKYDAVYIAIGVSKNNKWFMDSSNIPNIIYASEFLQSVNEYASNGGDISDYKFGKNVVIIGGGNVAIDSARTAIRLGSKVTIIYRRGKEQLPARRDEVESATKEGVVFKMLSNPIKVIVDENNNVTQLECEKMQLAEVDESGRQNVKSVPDSGFIVDTDTVILALGSKLNAQMVANQSGVELNNYGYISTCENGVTDNAKVFAGGDCVTGAKTVVSAMAMAIKTAKAMDEYLKNS